MHEIIEVLALLVVVTAVSATARKFDLPGPVLLVVLGIGGSFVPHVPAYALDPDLVFFLVLPPLLYSAALSSSLIAIRANRRPITLLSVGYVLFSTILVGVVAYLVVPGLSLATAFVLGAVVAPPDAVAASAIARKVGLPRRVVTILEGESLINDATALTAFRVATAAVVGGGFSWWEAGWRFALASVGGIVVGVAVTAAVLLIRRRLDDPVVENAVSLLTPFAAFLPAEEVGASGVVAVVVTGLLLGHQSTRFVGSAARLQAQAVWRMIDFLLEGAVFLLIGLQLRAILDALDAYGAVELTTSALAVTLAVVLGRFVWVYPATYVPRMLFARVREQDPSPPWQYPFVISWAGMRGVVSLAAAFAIPVQTATGGPFPQRELLIFLTFVVIFATLIVQGTTLRAVIRRLGLRTDPVQDRLGEAQAAQAASDAALSRLDELVAAGDGTAAPAEVVEQLRQRARVRGLVAWERLGDPSRETPTAAYRRLRIEMLEAERDALVRMRDLGRIDDHTMRRVQRDLDYEEAVLRRD